MTSEYTATYIIILLVGSLLLFMASIVVVFTKGGDAFLTFLAALGLLIAALVLYATNITAKTDETAPLLVHESNSSA